MSPGAQYTLKPMVRSENTSRSTTPSDDETVPADRPNFEFIASNLYSSNGLIINHLFASRTNRLYIRYRRERDSKLPTNGFFVWALRTSCRPNDLIAFWIWDPNSTTTVQIDLFQIITVGKEPPRSSWLTERSGIDLKSTIVGIQHIGTADQMTTFYTAKAFSACIQEVMPHINLKAPPRRESGVDPLQYRLANTPISSSSQPLSRTETPFEEPPFDETHCESTKDDDFFLCPYYLIAAVGLLSFGSIGLYSLGMQIVL